MSSVVEVKNVRKKYPLYEKKRDKIREAFSITGRKYHRDFEALKGISFSARSRHFWNLEQVLIQNTQEWKIFISIHC